MVEIIKEITVNNVKWKTEPIPNSLFKTLIDTNNNFDESRTQIFDELKR